LVKHHWRWIQRNQSHSRASMLAALNLRVTPLNHSTIRKGDITSNNIVLISDAVHSGIKSTISFIDVFLKNGSTTIILNDKVKIRQIFLQIRVYRFSPVYHWTNAGYSFTNPMLKLYILRIWT